MKVCAIIVSLCLASTQVSQAIIIQGAGSESANAFPFGDTPIDGFAGNRYQQVYSSAAFPGPITIAAIGFFHDNSPGGSFNSGNYTFELSVTSKAVDGLDTVNFDGNVTGAVHSFAVHAFTGGPASSFQIVGTPFSYVPAQGNLLLDIKIPGGVTHSGGGGFFDSWNGDAGGVFSRAHNFGTGYEGRGLETEFVPVPEPSTVLLAALGLVSFTVLRWRRKR